MRSSFLPFYMVLLSWASMMFGQTDTVFAVYPSDNGTSSTIRAVRLLRDGNIGLIQGDYYKLLIVDSKGSIIRSAKLGASGGHIIHSYMEWMETDTNYVILANTVKDGVYYIATVGVSKDLEHHFIIDTARLPEQERILYFRKTHFNIQRQQYEVFSVISSAYSNDFVAQCYFSLKTDFTFDRVLFFKTSSLPSASGTFVMDFYWVSSSERYAVSLFTNRFLLMDRDLNILSESQPRFEYQEPSGIWSVGGGNVADCFPDGGNVLTCLTCSIFNGPSDVSIVRYAVEPDTIRALQAFPLNVPSLEMNVWPHLRQDHAGNYVLAGTSGLFPLTAKHKLKIAKFSNTLERMWDIQFDPGNKNFEVWDMAIDDKNNIIIVGKALDRLNLTSHGFMLKVYADGRLTTSVGRPDVDKRRYEVVLMPNPTTATLCLQAPAEDLHWLRLWSADGRLVLSESVTAPHCFDLPAALPAGVYAVEVLFADGYWAVRKVVVVR